MKETFYFSHDLNARNDEKIVKLIQKEGLEGYGIFWIIIEKLYEADGFLEEDYDCLAFDMRTDCECIKRIIKNYELFSISNKKISSKSVLARLRKRKGKSESARQSANIRWNKQKKEDANAMRLECERNAIKESKVKESKVNNIARTSLATPDLLKDKNKHIQIIGLYAKGKKIKFENKEQQTSFIRRNLRPARDLTGYDFSRIADVMKYLIDNADFKWTIETVNKYITEDLDNLKDNASKIAII